MDRRLVGQWYKEEMGETVDIFDEEPLRIKLSFASTGFCHFEPSCVYEQDGMLCWALDNETYRMVYHVKSEEDQLVGWYTLQGTDVPVRYRRVSETPSDEPFCFVPPHGALSMPDETRIDILRRHADFATGSEAPVATEWRLGEPVPAALEKYGYAEAVRGWDAPDDALAFRLLDFVCDHFRHDGGGGTGGASVAELVAFCEAHDGCTNCRGLALLLAALLRSNGIKARHVTCMPYEVPFDDCHVVVDCLLPSGQRVMLDPTSRLYYRDAQGKLVSLRRLREMLIAGEPVFHNGTASYNGLGFDPEGNREYMVKNTFRFARSTVCGDGVDTENGIQLLPLGYDILVLPDAPWVHPTFDDERFWAM